ncbi:cation:proton antiporter [Abyssisolibacter fermentans]|uniref:cation:proton antiporter n=1 Tax=Abyssisolibacter fermentans TaxID=1766203 RepID=UPI00082AAC90|nr:cation:proton antiporter [Abyssisolibacter fermentans]
MDEGALFLLEIGLILLFANIGGYISKKLEQPAVLGQILIGLIIGPSVLNLVSATDFINHMAEIGVILLMFIAGLETDLDDLKASGQSSAIIAIGGVIFPFIFGMGVVYLLKANSTFQEQLFVGVILTATSVSITVQALRELNRLRTKQGMAILGAAIIDDVVGIILLAVVVSAINPAEGTSILFVILKIIAFFVIALILGIVFSKTITKYSDIMRRDGRLLTSALIFCFFLAFIAEEMGVAAIIGAYITGVIFSTTPHRNRVSHEIQNIAYALFTPIFFVNIGLKVQLHGIGNSILLSVGIILAAIFGKVIGCLIGARVSKFNLKESFQISIGMIPRAEVALIVTSLGLKLKVIGHDIFTSIILLVLVSTIITPILLKIVYKNDTVENDKLA